MADIGWIDTQNRVDPLVGFETATTASSTTITLQKPAGTASGDLMLFLAKGNSPFTWTELSGWTELYDTVATNLQYRVATSADDPATDYTFTISSASAIDGILVTFRGVSIDVLGTNNLNISQPITVTNNHSLLLCLVQSQTVGTDLQPLYMELLGKSETNNLVCIYRQYVEAGTTGTRSIGPVNGMLLSLT